LLHHGHYKLHPGKAGDAGAAYHVAAGDQGCCMKSSTDQRVREQAAPDAAQRQARVGFFYALSAYLWWGFIPLYFKLLETIAPLTVLAHRVIWSVIFLLAIVAIQRRWGEVRAALAVWSTVGRLAIAAVLVAIN